MTTTDPALPGLPEPPPRPEWVEIDFEGEAHFGRGEDTTVDDVWPDGAPDSWDIAALRRALDTKYHDADSLLHEFLGTELSASLRVGYTDGHVEHDDLFVPPTSRAMRAFKWHDEYPGANCAWTLSGGEPVPEIGAVAQRHSLTARVVAVRELDVPDGFRPTVTVVVGVEEAPRAES